VEHLSDGEGGYLGQAVGSSPQGFFQEVERPGGGAILGRSRCALHLAEDACAGGSVVGRLGATAVTQRQGLQTSVVEAGDEGSDGVTALATVGVRGVLKVGAVRDRQQETCAGDRDGRSGGGATETGEGLAFLLGQATERMFLTARHVWTPRDRARPVISSREHYGYRRDK
jgi:hypothetical protein